MEGKRDLLIKKLQILFIQLTAIAAGVIPLGFGIFISTKAGTIVAQLLHIPFLEYIIPIGLTVAIILYIWMLIEIIRGLHRFVKNNLFTPQAVVNLQRIERLGGILWLLGILGLPIVFGLAQYDDAPGLIIFWFIFVCFVGSLGVYASLLKKFVKGKI